MNAITSNNLGVNPFVAIDRANLADTTQRYLDLDTQKLPTVGEFLQF